MLGCPAALSPGSTRKSRVWDDYQILLCGCWGFPVKGIYKVRLADMSLLLSSALVFVTH